MKQKRFCLNCFLFLAIVLFAPSFLIADCWIQTNWSGGEGFSQWQNPAGYYEGNGVNGFRKSGFLTLFAPDFKHFYSIGKLPESFGVYAFYSNEPGHYYAGSGNTEAGSGRLFVSTDFGNSWDTTTIISNAVYKAQSIFLPSFGEIFVGTDPERIYRSNQMGDSTWNLCYSVNNSEGTYISSLLETEDHYLYAAGVGGVNNQGKIYISTDYGEDWFLFPKQPEVSNISPMGIYKLIYTLNGNFYAAGYFTNYGARIFRLLAGGQDWEVCANLPDTSCKPFAMDIGYDTLGNYGAIYVGTGNAEGKVFLSLDGGDSWNTCVALQGAWSVNSIKVDLDGTVYAACWVYGEKKGFGVKVFRSTNMGASWDSTSAIGGALTNTPTSFTQTPNGFLLLGTENEGEIFKSAFVDSGYLVSSVYDVGTENGSSKFGNIFWEEILNGQYLHIKVRTGNDSTMAGALPWDVCPDAMNGQDISSLVSVNDGAQYIQYRVELSTDSIDYSPELKEIDINYSIDTIPPSIDTAYATDGSNVVPGVDTDDSVIVIFSDSTNMPQIEPDNINLILKLSNGHSWLDNNQSVFTEWVTPCELKVSWPGLNGEPTVAVRDTIYPDTLTITDRWGNACFKPVVLTGSFGPSPIGETVSSKNEKGCFRVYPTVSKDVIFVRMNIESNIPLELEFFDVTGREIDQIFFNNLTGDTYSIKYPVKNLPSGIYYIKLRRGTKALIKKFILIK